MTTAPIVMPEVISGLSLLLLFVALQQAIGWPQGMGAVTITLAHISFCMAYVTVVIQSRLAGFDESLEEAAQDLGARPAKVFWRITLPLILPAVLAGWLLAFTLSWDDLVISQFVAGPGSSTLPMVIFSKVRLGVSPDVNALATLMVSRGGERSGGCHDVAAPSTEAARARCAARRRGQPLSGTDSLCLVNCSVSMSAAPSSRRAWWTSRPDSSSGN